MTQKVKDIITGIVKVLAYLLQARQSQTQTDEEVTDENE